MRDYQVEMITECLHTIGSQFSESVNNLAEAIRETGLSRSHENKKGLQASVADSLAAISFALEDIAQAQTAHLPMKLEAKELLKMKKKSSREL